jgi:hypothetical protein
MKLMISRFIAIIILVIPGLTAMIGFLKIKDAVFLYYSQHGNSALVQPTFDWFNFIVGFLLFAVGIGFLAGWIYSRDQKRSYGKRNKTKKTVTD